MSADDQQPDNNDQLKAAEAAVARILAREGTALASTAHQDTHADAGAMEREERRARGRIQGLSTELEDVSEVEYRQLRLERVVLVGLVTTGTIEQTENSLRELAALAMTAGSEVLDVMIQRRPKPDNATFLGAGKAAELHDMVAALGADTVIVDAELSPSQRRGLEDVVRVKVVDRTAVILDIFAQHAKSREGKAQVELAQMEYMLPRLRGWGESMSRQAGGRVAGGAGIGSRGPGETKIELDRRRIHRRMSKLKHEIAEMKKSRDVQRSNRSRSGTASVAIVGYTNAGKSSLMNRLTDADVMVQDALFATLDPTVRAAETEDGRSYTLTDTVGFVANLPHQLVEAFRSTLEEVAAADLIVHVVDAAHPDPAAQIQSVHEVLHEIEGTSDIPELIVFNKADLATPEQVAIARSLVRECVVTSASTGRGIEELRQAIADRLPQLAVAIDLVVPYGRGDLVARAYDEGQIESRSDLAAGTRLVGRVHAELGAALEAAAVPAQ